MIALALPAAATADEIILHSGERFVSDRVWEEGAKIRFNMHGLIVSVDKSDVAAVMRGNTPAPKLQAPAPPPLKPVDPSPVARPAAPTKKPAPANPIKPAPATTTQPTRAAAASPKNPDTKPKKAVGIGFDGLRWQLKPSQIQGIQKFKTDPVYGGVDQYYRPEGNLTLGDVYLDGLVFGFWQNRLYTITMWVDGRPAFERLRDAVLEHYGNGKQSKTIPDRIVWMEKRTDRMLEFDTHSNTGILWMRSRALDAYVKRQYPE